MKRKLLRVVTILIVAAFVLCGCANTLPSYNPNDPVGNEPARAMAVIVYQGHDLSCLEQTTAYNFPTYVCDFAAFYNEPPITGSTLPLAQVALTTIPYRGGTLYCFKFNTDHAKESFTCDFERFYRENKHPAPMPS